MNCRVFLLLLSMLLAPAPEFAQNGPETETVAQVDGEKISSQDLKQVSGEPLAKLEEQAFALKQQKLDELIADRLVAREAHKRNVSVESLLATEITSKVPPVTSEEIHSLYEANKNRLQQPESELREQLQKFLRDQKIASRRQEFVNSLRGNAKVVIYLNPPDPFRAQVRAEGPSRGVTGAPVTIVEFEDFQCPFCKKVHDTVEQVLVRYKDKVRIVHRDFPLESLHPAAWKAHEAARCAEKQGKFWQYRDVLYANAPHATPEELSKYAGQVGIDVPAFRQCLDSGESKAIVKRDEDEGNRLGIEGTPTFFINGRLLSGEHPEADFARIIDGELSKRASDTSLGPLSAGRFLF
jgi:protein-disulfide isomerase